MRTSPRLAMWHLISPPDVVGIWKFPIPLPRYYFALPAWPTTDPRAGFTEAAYIVCVCKDKVSNGR